MSITIKNLESALAGESQAHIKYRYFARIARAEGFEDVAKHFEHTINANYGHNFDLSDKQMASHAKKAHDVKTQIEHHHGAEAAKDTHEHSHMAADHEEGTTGGDTGFHHEFAKKHLGGVNSEDHKKYKAQIDKQDLKMHGDTGVTSHHED